MPPRKDQEADNDPFIVRPTAPISVVKAAKYVLICKASVLAVVLGSNQEYLNFARTGPR